MNIFPKHARKTMFWVGLNHSPIALWLRSDKTPCPRCWFVRVVQIFRSSFERFGGRRVVWKIHFSVVCVYVCECVCECTCMRDMYIQLWRHAPKHMHVHILIQTLMYVEVLNIIGCNQHVPDPNKHERQQLLVRVGRGAGTCEAPRILDYHCSSAPL